MCSDHHAIAPEGAQDHDTSVEAAPDDAGALLGPRYIRRWGEVYWYQGAPRWWGRLPQKVRADTLLAIAEALRGAADDVEKLSKLARGGAVEVALSVPHFAELTGSITVELPVQHLAPEAL